jgi:hypothetical protein
MNFFHTHADDFRGTHAHEISGSTVEHTHSGPVDPEEGVEVVEVFGMRYKAPKPAPEGSERAALEAAVDFNALVVPDSIVQEQAVDATGAR